MNKFGGLFLLLLVVAFVVVPMLLKHVDEAVMPDAGVYVPRPFVYSGLTTRITVLVPAGCEAHIIKNEPIIECPLSLTAGSPSPVTRGNFGTFHIIPGDEVSAGDEQ